jgi:hypothetical protein
MPLDDVGLHFGRELVAGDVRRDQAGRHAVHADAVRPELARHRLGEAEDTGFRRRVMGAAEDAAAALRGNGRHAGDRALLAAAHMRNEGLAEIENAGQVHVDHALPALGADVHHLQGLGDSGVVDQDVDLAERGERLFGGLAAIRQVGDVACDADMFGAELRGRLLCAGRVEVKDGNARPVLGEELRCRATNSARACGARDHGGLIGEQHADPPRQRSPGDRPFVEGTP